MTGLKPWTSPRRRCRAGEAQRGDLLDDDHIAPSTMGLADAATPPRLHMLERAPSTGSSSSLPGRAQHCVAVSARHIAHGSLAVTRTMLTGALVPVARASFHVSRAVLTTTCRVAACTTVALARAACRAARFAAAPRYSIIGVDGSQLLQLQQQQQQQRQQLLLALTGGPSSTDDEDDGADTSGDRCGTGGSRGRSGSGSGWSRRRRRGDHEAIAAPPEPLSNLKGARITLRDCRHTRLRLEYCTDCVVVASHLQSVELLLVCCTRVKLVLRHCDGLLLRELQCSGMADFVRRRCPNFAHEIVCLRCACKPRSSSAGGGY